MREQETLNKDIMQLNIDPKSIEDAIKQAVIDSALGTIIKDAIHTKLCEWKIKDSIVSLIDKEICKVIVKLLQEEVNTNIMKEEIKKQLSDEMIRGIVGKAIEKIWS